MKGFALLAALLWPVVAPAALGNGKAAGSAAAPITIEVFSDYECPSCKVVHEQTLAPLVREFVTGGKVYLVHHDFPLPQHKYSRLAATYAGAAARLGVYDEVADALFRSQVAWSANGKVDEAACANLSAATARKLRALLKDPGIAAEIESDVKLAQAAGINQTPTLLVNHRGKRYPFSGNVNYALLRTLLNDLLKK